MADYIISLLTDSDSSDRDLNKPRTSIKYDLNSKDCNSKKTVHSLSESDLSIEEENIPKFLYSKEKKVAAKKIKSTSTGSSLVKTSQKKENSSSKLELKQWKDKLKCIKPNECLKYISVVIPEHFSVDVVFKDVLNTLEKSGFKYEVTDSDETAVTWNWKGVSSEFSKKSHLAVIWHLHRCISLVQTSSLVLYFDELMKKKPNQRIYLILHGTQKDLRDENVRKKVDYALCELELTTGITHSKFYNPHDLANYILHLSKSVSQELYRAELEKLEQEKTFYLHGRSHNSVRVDKDNNGMKKLWVQQIAAIHRLPFDSAKVLCRHHPTPYCLYETYKNLSTIKEKQDLLQDISVGRGGVAKRLGPKMSGKIALLFANSDGDLHLSDWI
ncbi:unnamed protein product [Nezara viridula]|uniref:Crossover junction endonuclease EME1 n=1 Tax=Nezara viridula TaxID=85310 RepID=A0A9P0EEP3_NEZVI|nr:unnamed protein product [Nezara viridula]